MPMNELRGNFNYNALKDAMQKRGVRGASLNAALTKVADQNNIDDITKLDGNKSITVSGSIFEQYASGVNNVSKVSNPFEVDTVSNNQTETSNNNSSEIKLFGNNDFTNESTLPEIYNDDDYEVVGYDEYYNFGDTQQAQSQSQTQNQAQAQGQRPDNVSMTFDEFKEAHMNGTYGNPQFDNATSPFGQTNNDNSNDKDAMLYNIFAQYDADDNGILDNNELQQFEEMAQGAATAMGGMYDSSDDEQDIPQEGQDPFGSNTMEMDMQQQEQSDSK